jgi:hypothetical protein
MSTIWVANETLAELYGLPAGADEEEIRAAIDAREEQERREIAAWSARFFPELGRDAGAD